MGLDRATAPWASAAAGQELGPGGPHTVAGSTGAPRTDAWSPAHEHPSWGLTVTGGGTAGMAVRRCTWQVQHRHQLRGHHARTCHGSTSRSTATPSGLGLLQEPRVPSPSHQAPLELVCLGGRGAGRVAGLEGAAVPPPRASGHQLSQLPAQQQPHLVLSCWGLLPGPGQPQAPVLGASQGGLWVERPRPAAAVRRGPRQQARPSTALRSLSCSSCGVLCCPLELRRGLKAPRSWAGGSQERTPHCPSGSRCPALRPRGQEGGC